jgi:heat shock protein HslJ
MRSLTLLFPTLLLAGCLLSCSASPRAYENPTSPPAATLERPSIFGVWKVVAIETAGGGRLVPPTSGRPVELEFAAPVDGQARVNGYAGVNRFGGPYSHSLGEGDVGVLLIGSLAATRMAGPEDAMRFEDALLDALGRARTIAFDGREAAIDTGDERIVIAR